MSKNSIDNRQKLVALRHTHFQKHLFLNYQLIDLVGDINSHAFLRNPASQNIFLYLTNYVRAVLEYWFSGNLDKIHVLDWGCGKGHISFLMREMGVKITSCDVRGADDSAFEQITPIIKKASIKVVALEHPYLLPFNNASFDVVLSFGVLEHVSNDLASLAEIHRVLKPSGLFFCFFLPYYLSWTQHLAHLRGDFYHDRLYSQKMVKHLLKQTNFELIDLWHRQLLPKNSVSYPKYHFFEFLDQWLTQNTPLKYTATNIEFVAVKR